MILRTCDLLDRRVVSVNRRARLARLDDGRVIPIVEGHDMQGQPVTDMRRAVCAVAELPATPPIGFYIDFRNFTLDPPS